MATDNAVMRYKDIKYYNEKLQDSMPSGGGVSSLADLGITLSAAEINNLPSNINAVNDKVEGHVSIVSRSFQISSGGVVFPGESPSPSYVTVNTYLPNNTDYKIIGYYIDTNGSSGYNYNVTFYESGSYWYAYISGSSSSTTHYLCICYTMFHQ